ncbi:hypothetical protein J6590_082555 [Homalodisca vitripennis]|nr:hypothetical protein J6590_082555 [Homalodisca vitripennis]
MLHSTRIFGLSKILPIEQAGKHVQCLFDVVVPQNGTRILLHRVSSKVRYNTVRVQTFVIEYTSHVNKPAGTSGFISPVVRSCNATPGEI